MWDKIVSGQRLFPHSSDGLSLIPRLIRNYDVGIHAHTSCLHTHDAHMHIQHAHTYIMHTHISCTTHIMHTYVMQTQTIKLRDSSWNRISLLSWLASNSQGSATEGPLWRPSPGPQTLSQKPNFKKRYYELSGAQ